MRRQPDVWSSTPVQQQQVFLGRLNVLRRPGLQALSSPVCIGITATATRYSCGSDQENDAMARLGRGLATRSLL